MFSATHNMSNTQPQQTLLPPITWKAIAARDGLDEREEYFLSSISWVISSPPSTADASAVDGDGPLPLTEEQWNAIAITEDTNFKVLDYNHDGESDDPFISITLPANSTVYQVFASCYRASCGYGPEDALLEWDQCLGDHIYFEGFSWSERHNAYFMQCGS
jgi:hypothetical protein